MKTKLFFSLALYFGLFLKSSPAQTYIPFPDSNAVWSVTYRHNSHFYTRHYKLFGNTIINSISYSKLYYNDGLIDTVIEMNSPNTFYYGALRQDTSEKKVYFLPDTTFSYIHYEYVLYDFNLNVGDTLLIPLLNSFNITAVCTFINYEMIGGISRKVVHVDYLETSNYSFWAEGIGDLGGLFDFMNTTYYSTVLLCLTNNDSIIYHYDSPLNFYYSPPFADSSIFSTCSYHGIINPYTNTDVQKSIYTSRITIYPNPFTHSTLILIPESFQPNNFTIDIFDVQGKKIKELHSINNHQLKLYRPDFKSAGVYFVRIKSEKYFETIKLLVQ